MEEHLTDSLRQKKNEIMEILEQLIDIIYLNIAQKTEQAPGSQYDWHFFKSKRM